MTTTAADETAAFARGRSLTTFASWPPWAVHRLLGMSMRLKYGGGGGRHHTHMDGAVIALLFAKASTRTRCAFEVATALEGGAAVHLSADGAHFGGKESAADSARVFLASGFSGIQWRGDLHSDVETLARYAQVGRLPPMGHTWAAAVAAAEQRHGRWPSGDEAATNLRCAALAAGDGIPVWNGLSRDSHPTQALADALTCLEAVRAARGDVLGPPPATLSVVEQERAIVADLRGVKLAFVGDAANNVAYSLAVMGSKCGMEVRLVAPPQHLPSAAVVERLTALCAADGMGGRVVVESDVAAGVRGVDFIVGDVWVSMGEPKSEWQTRTAALMPYRMTMDLWRAAGNPRCKFMHCLPALHDDQTQLARELMHSLQLPADGIECSDELFESEHSVVFHQAANRMHTIRAIMVATV